MGGPEFIDLTEDSSQDEHTRESLLTKFKTGSSNFTSSSSLPNATPRPKGDTLDSRSSGKDGRSEYGGVEREQLPVPGSSTRKYERNRSPQHSHKMPPYGPIPTSKKTKTPSSQMAIGTTHTNGYSDHSGSLERPATAIKRSADMAFGYEQHVRHSHNGDGKTQKDITGLVPEEQGSATQQIENGMYRFKLSTGQSSKPAVGNTERPPQQSQSLSTRNIRKRFTEEDNKQIRYLKEELKWSWSDITRHFPGRTKASLTVHYSNNLANRDRSVISPGSTSAAYKGARNSSNQDIEIRRSAKPSGENLRDEISSDAKSSSANPTVATKSDTVSTRVARSDTVTAIANKNSSFPNKITEPNMGQGRAAYHTEISKAGPSDQEQSSSPVHSDDVYGNRTPTLKNSRDLEATSLLSRDRRREIEPSRSMEATSNLSWDTSERKNRRDSISLKKHSPVYSIPILPIDPRKQIGTSGPAQRNDKSRTTRKKCTVSYPYLSFDERFSLRETLRFGNWRPPGTDKFDGTILHVDLTNSEISELATVIQDNVRRSSGGSVSYLESSIHYQLKTMLRSATEDTIHSIAERASKGAALRFRDPTSLRSFMTDVAEGRNSKDPQVLTFDGVHQDSDLYGGGKAESSTLLRQRELGRSGPRAWQSTCGASWRTLKSAVYESLGPKLSFTGTSGDVNTVAWARDGNLFSVGSACLTDPNSMQYNLPKNLMLGDVYMKTIRELPDHHTARNSKRPRRGVNSSHEMHISQDPRLFSSISAVAFSPSGQSMYSAGYDGRLRAWDVSRGVSQATVSFIHEHAQNGVTHGVDVMAVSKNGTVATGCRTHNESITVCGVGEIRGSPGREILYAKDKYTSKHAMKRTDMFPSTIKFDPFGGNYLLAGFCTQSHDDAKDKFGDIRLWEVNHKHEQIIYGGVRNVFDCAWNIHGSLGAVFAVASTAGSNCNRGVHSVVKLYDRRTEMSSLSGYMELECSARDVNDVVFSPYDGNHISVGCTDGVTYVWDLRKPDEIMHKLTHGDPLLPLRHDIPREDADTGVRFNAWGHERRRLYTGSSDGMVKVWDIYQAPEDVLVKNAAVLESGVMSGSFSPDMDRLLLGEVKGTISVLEVGSELFSIKDTDDFEVISAPLPEGLLRSVHAQDEDSGAKAARRRVANGEIVLKPLGGLPVRQAVQGPNYIGPFDPHPEADSLRDLARKFQEKMSVGSETQCQLPSCRESSFRCTEEESGDSGRSLERIPDSMRRGVLDTSKSASRTVSAAAKCTKCGSQVRPRAFEGQSDAELRAHILCERCGFACLRCGGPAAVSNELETLWCLACDLRWDIDVLGYNIKPGRGKSRRRKGGGEVDITALPNFKRVQTQTDKNLKTSIGEDGTRPESGDLSEYYHSLWMDRPPSPPL